MASCLVCLKLFHSHLFPSLRPFPGQASFGPASKWGRNWLWTKAWSKPLMHMRGPKIQVSKLRFLGIVKGSNVGWWFKLMLWSRQLAHHPFRTPWANSFGSLTRSVNCFTRCWKVGSQRAFVVIGDESAGKSTILEQLANVPIFSKEAPFLHPNSKATLMIYKTQPDGSKELEGPVLWTSCVAFAYSICSSRRLYIEYKSI